ncbi:MAG TPA: hypothetical protein VIK11_08035 [Tepidiformaceae bacterium]
MTGVTTDYAGASRDASRPTMGAFEYAPFRYHIYAAQVTRAT